MRLSEITFNSTRKDATNRYDFDDFLGHAEPTGKRIGEYELWWGEYGTLGALLIKSNDDEGFLGALYLIKHDDEQFPHTEIMFDPEIQGKKLALPMYLYVIQEMGFSIMSDSSQTAGGAAIWKKLAEMPGVNVYVYHTSDHTYHGEYDPKDSGRVYGPEDWRHKIRLVATTDTVVSVDESLKESVDIPDADDDFFKRNRFMRTEYAGMKLVYGHAYDLFQIYAYSAYNQAMGAVMFRYDSDCDCYQADDVFVETKFRRQGVATALYDFAKQQLDAPIKPSTAQTGDGSKFWGKKEVWESATPDDIFYMISDIHTGHNDIETDEEFQQWVGSFDKYELKDIPLSKLKVSQSNINADKAKSYIKQKNAPPIVVDGTNYWIIDGHHRVAAALARGDKTIKGYVGLNEGDVVQFNRPERMRDKARALLYAMSQLGTYTKQANDDKTITYTWLNATLDNLLDDRFEGAVTVDDFVFFVKRHPKIDYEFVDNRHRVTFDRDMDMTDIVIVENFHDGKKKGKSKPGRVKKAGASCQGSVSHLRQMAKKYDGERGRMYHWCANMKGGKKKK